MLDCFINTCTLLRLEGKMLTSLPCPCEIKKCFGESDDSMNIKQTPHTEV